MDTIIHTRVPIDLGAGEQTTIRVPDTKVSTDQAGNLVVYAEEGGPQVGSLTLHRDVWWFATRGDLAFNGDDVVLVRRNR